MPDKGLHLLALNGGGVRDLSALIILEQLIETLKPCDCFDMIGRISTREWVVAIFAGYEYR